MIPVEDTAGRAAAVAHDQPERTPDQHADQVTDIEEHGDQKNDIPVDHPCKKQYADHGCHNRPDNENFIGGFGGTNNVFLQCRGIDTVYDRTEINLEQFLRTQTDMPVCRRDQLPEHVQDPKEPEDVKYGKSLEEIESIKDLQHFPFIEIHPYAS